MQATGISAHRLGPAGRAPVSVQLTVNSYRRDCLSRLNCSPEMVECIPRPNGVRGRA